MSYHSWKFVHAGLIETLKRENGNWLAMCIIMAPQDMKPGNEYHTKYEDMGRHNQNWSQRPSSLLKNGRALRQPRRYLQGLEPWHWRPRTGVIPRSTSGPWSVHTSTPRSLGCVHNYNRRQERISTPPSRQWVRTEKLVVAEGVA